MTVSPFERKRVGIFPRSRFQSESRLLASLKRLYPVDFSPEGEVGFDQLDAAVFFSDENMLSSRAFAQGISSFVFRRSSKTIGLEANASVCFSDHNILHPAFRKARITLGRASQAAELNPTEGDSTLASCDWLRLWLFRSNGRAELHTVATELPSVENLLWEHLRPDGWLASLPLLYFLRRVTADIGWSTAPQHACFIFDDPNLHTAGYGYLDYASLAAHARVHNYHVAIATVPLDAWYAGRRAVDVFRGNRERLSLLIHGNDHTRNELGCAYTDGDALRRLAQALRRVAHFERKTGLRVERVIAPPHGGCSESVLEQAPRVAIEALCTSAVPLVRCLKWTRLPLDFGLLPAWLGPGYCPVIRRWDLVYGLTPLRLAAFLGQPLIAYGHHQDCAGGFGQLAEIAHQVNTWSETTWSNVETILRGNYRIKRDAELMHVQMWSRHVHVPVPEGVSHVSVHSESVQEPILVASNDGPAQECTPGVPFRVSCPGSLQLRMRSSEAIDPVTVRPPAYRVWPSVRRTLSMGRDRLLPVVRNFRPSVAVEFHTAKLAGNQRH